MNQTNETICSNCKISNPYILWDCLFIKSERERGVEGRKWDDMVGGRKLGNNGLLPQSYITYNSSELSSLGGEKKYMFLSLGILSWMPTALWPVTTESPASAASKKWWLLISLGSIETTVSSIPNKVLVRPHLVVIRGDREVVRPPDMRVINPCWNVVDYKKC